MATIDELRAHALNPNVRQFLDVIAKAEGAAGYDTAFGGGRFESLADHPRQLHSFTQTDGKANKTSAAGRYQFLQGTWDDVAGKLGLTDFGPESRDLAAVELLRRNGSLEPLLAGDFDTAIKRSGATWASLPSSPYPQPKRSEGFMANALDKVSGTLFPSAQATTVDDRWSALKEEFSAGGQLNANGGNDPWDSLKREFAQPPVPGHAAGSGESLRAPGQTAPTVAPATQETGSGGYLPQIGSGLLEGVTGVFGAPVDLANAVIGVGMKGLNSAFGTDLQPSAEPFGGAAWWRRGVPLAPPSEETGPQIARRAAQSVGGASVPVAATARTAGQLVAGLTTALGGGLGGATAQQLYPGNVTAEMLGEVLGSLGVGASISGLANRTARQAAEKAVPSVVDLKRQAASQFEEAHRMGVTATQAQTRALASDIRGLATQEGLISPTGRVSEAYPKARDALRILDDYATGSMNVPQMQTVRKVLADAAGSADKAERRIATLMLRKFDDFTAPLAPQLSEARSLYSQAMRGDQLETLRELAKSRGGQYSVSGMENALRTEYRQLNNQIIKGRERGWTPEQVDAIRRVAEGTPATNTARQLGKLAPTGVVSAGLGGGVPFMVGNAIGGPGLGAAFGAGAMGTGLAARDIAARLTNRNAMLAELLARNGGIMPLAVRPELHQQMLGAALGGQAALHSN